MRKIVFAVQVLVLIIALPLYIFAELNHGSTDPQIMESSSNSIEIPGSRVVKKSIMPLASPANAVFEIKVMFHQKGS